ncbi:acyl-CoA carboxylase subunit epsilon [Ornithinimicrobium avium]|uniref:Acyl-CoA carboxylase subunit epsilon n=1 Tax=Ornithinimicrobium avium TaxID=2283195 RepID=A0A345NLF5_9MICO|nr:acyl-CoA carboxylase subunit epsilon [Ornithinimicrobium avium]AXH95863.1 acyl-CoA carboxylase subunit epsilon [Ornithinimicrobium avium]
MSAEEQAVTVTGGEAAPATPVILVERGNPTPEQLAALTVVLTAASSGSGTDQRATPTSLWRARAPFSRTRPTVGPGGWRASALPR